MVSLNTSLVCKHLVNFSIWCLKMKRLNFIVGVNFYNVHDDKLMIFGDRVAFCKVDDGST